MSRHIYMQPGGRFSRCLSKVQQSMQAQLRVIQALFQDQILKKVEEDIAQHENKVIQLTLPPAIRKSVITLVKAREQKFGRLDWKIIGSYSQNKKGKGLTLLSPSGLPDHHKLLCQSSQEPLPVGGITSAYEQKCCVAGQK